MKPSSVRLRALLGCLASLVSGCGGVDGTTATPLRPDGLATASTETATSASISRRDTSSSIELVGLTCPDGRRNSLTLHPDARAVQGICGDSSFGVMLGEEGELGPRGDYGLGVPGLEPGDDVVAFQLIRGRLWVAFDDNQDVAGRRVDRLVVYTRTTKGWERKHTGDMLDRLTALGAWPGGVIAAFTSPTKPVWFTSLEGAPTAPLPVLPPGQVHGLVTVGEGYAFGMVQPPGDIDFAVLRWAPGRRDPSQQVFPRMVPSLLDETPNTWFFVRSPSDAFVALGRDGTERGDASLSILRFDGMAWKTSGVIPGERFLTSFAASPDGALWALLSCGIRLEFSEIWRLGPGLSARWERIAADVVGLDSDLTAHSIMSAGEHDLLFAGTLKDRGWGLYRIRIGG